jgi:hypothetical protein
MSATIGVNSRSRSKLSIGTVPIEKQQHDLWREPNNTGIIA